MPRSRPVKRLSDGACGAVRAAHGSARSLLDPALDSGHAAAVVFARKPDGTWRICYDYRSLVASTPSRGRLSSRSRTLTHCSTARWGSLFFTKLYLASSYHKLLVRAGGAADRWKTSFRSQLGQLESTLGGRRLCGPAQGTVPSPVDNANVVRRSAALHVARQLLPPLRGGLRLAVGAVDGARQPDGALHVDRCLAGELRPTEAGPFLGPGAAHV